MKKNSIQIISKVLLISCLIVTFSCKKLLNVEPENQVDITKNYRNVYDANAAVVGIYGKLLTIADRYMVLNELRADLASPTANADRYLHEISTHQVSADNPWADPRPFYNIILNCNDALKNFDIMLKDNKMTNEEYRQRFSDVTAMRAWLYLQVGIHWGEVPYVTDAIETVDALKDVSKFPRIPFNQLLDNLIASLKDQYLDGYPAASAITGATNTSLNTTVDGYLTNPFFINKRCLLGDLYLWSGNYTEAAKLYKFVSERAFVNEGATSTGLSQYRPNFNQFTIRYLRQFDEASLVDDNTSTNSWRAIFGAPVTTGTDVNAEWIQWIPFDRNFQPLNPFIDLFSNQGGRYLITASKLALNNWNSQLQNNGIPYDARGRLTVRTINGQPVIAKHLYYFLNGTTFVPINILQKQGRWLMYRGATLSLHFSEAACRDNQVMVSYALLNRGITDVFSGIFPTPLITSTGRNVPTDVTDIMQTKKPAPYDLDGRNGEVPFYRNAWHRQIGTRSRANLVPLPASIALSGDVIAMENAIIDEAGLELAYEGNRWGDLLRVALRRNDASFVANKVFNKLDRDGNPAASAARAKLLSANGLYLPFNL